MLDDRGSIPGRIKDTVFTRTYRSSQRTTKSNIHCGKRGDLYQGLTRPERETDLSAATAEVWNTWTFTSTVPAHLPGVILGHRDNLMLLCRMLGYILHHARVLVLSDTCPTVWTRLLSASLSGDGLAQPPVTALLHAQTSQFLILVLHNQM